MLGALDVLAVQNQAAAIPGSPSAQQLLVNVPVPSSPLALLHVRILGSEAVWGCQEKSWAPAVLLPLGQLPSQPRWAVDGLGVTGPGHNGGGGLPPVHKLQQSLNSDHLLRHTQTPKTLEDGRMWDLYELCE